MNYYAPKSPDKPTHVLLVDDQRDVLDLTSHLLKRNGYSVESTTRPDRLPDLMVQKRPDVILLDVNLGKINGADLCKKIKHKVNGWNIPIIMISGDADLENIAAFCSADGHLSKPFAMSDLLLMISNAVGRT